MPIGQLLHSSSLEIPVLLVEKLQVEPTLSVHVIHGSRCVQHIFQAVALCHPAATGQTPLDSETGARWVARGEDQPSKIHHLIHEDRQL